MIGPFKFSTAIAMAMAVFAFSAPLLVQANAAPIPNPKPFFGPLPYDKPDLSPEKAANLIRGPTESVELTCQRIGAKVHSITEKECLGFEFFSTGASVKGAPILLKEFIEESNRTIKAKVLLVGGTHGDEYVAVSVVFKWLQFLQLDTHAFHWKVTPLLNPDGLLRKKSTRTNGNGVDLNRNLPTPNWTQESQAHWVNTTNSNPRRFPGSTALSEPENQWLVNEIESFRPDVIISTHAPHGLVDFDGPPNGPSQLGSLEQRFLGTYPGSLGNFAGVQLGLPVVTIEFKTAGSMPKPLEIETMWKDLIQWLEGRFPDGTNSI